jgi:ABC-type transporter Mla subunit MlaD
MAQRQSLSLAVLRHKTTAQARAALASASAASAETIDSAAKALDAARALSDGSARTLDQAQRTVRDARLGYRAGSETLPRSMSPKPPRSPRARPMPVPATRWRWPMSACGPRALGWSPADLTADLTPAPVPAKR